MAANERGQTVVLDVLATLADDVTKDLLLAEQITTGQTEVRAQAVVAAILPFAVLLLLVTHQRRFPRLLPHQRRLRRHLHRRDDGLLRLEADQRHRPIAGRTSRPRPARGDPVNGQVLAIAAVAAVAAYCLVRSALRTPAGSPPASRPYTDAVRGKLGTVVPRTAPPARSVWARSSPPPPTGSARCSTPAPRVTCSCASTGRPQRRHRRRRLPPPPARLHGRRFAVGILLALLLQPVHRRRAGRRPRLRSVGMLRWRAKLDRLTDDRKTTMRVEAHIVCQMLAVWLRTGDTPSGALDRLIARTQGIVPAELSEAAAQIRSGSPPVEVLERIAHQTAESSAARLYGSTGPRGPAAAIPAPCWPCPTARGLSVAMRSPAPWPNGASPCPCLSSP